MMNAIIENSWAVLNTSLSQARPSPISQVFENTNMAFTPSIMGDVFGGEEDGGVAYYNDTPLKHYNSTIGEGGADNQTSRNSMMFANASMPVEEEAEYIFDRSDVRAVLLVLYTIVFCCCFFGNLMVILVVTLHWRMRSITNFCLANLAFADMCVGIFCVYQNIVTYLMDSWIFGEFMCKMYHFINSLSTTASVLILVVICIERYLAIIHPMTCKQMLTLNRLRITIVFVWILSAAISSPRFYYFRTVTMPLTNTNGQYDIVCLPNRTLYNSKLMDMISMTVLFLIPLTIITILYTHIGIVLWKSSNNRMPAATPTPSVESSSSSDCYRETADHNIIQTVNLTLLPLSSQQILQQQNQPNRPGLLQGVGPASPPPMLTPVAGGTQAEKRSSFLPSPFICGSKSRKRRKHAKKHHQHCRAGQTPSLEGRVCANCIRNLQMNGNSAALGAGTSGGLITNGGLVSGGGGQEFIMNCKACQKPYMHQPHFFTQPGITCAPGCERVETTSFTQSCQHHHQNNLTDNGLCVMSTNSENVGEQKHPRTRDEATNSPKSILCCGGKARPTNICLNRQGSQDKSVSFTTTPPSPFCSKNCSCLDGNCAKTEPIVLVKFEKKNKAQSSKKNRKSQCTILMNTKSCHGASPAIPCTGNRRRLCSQGGGSSLDGDTDGDSPTTMSPSPPRFGCALCHPQGAACCREAGTHNASESHGTVVSVGIEASRGMHHLNLQHQNSCQRNFSFDHKRNLSVDSGISTAGRTNIEGSLCEQTLEGACGASCPSCGVSCVESSSYQLYRCPHYNNCTSVSPKIPHFSSTASSAPKRVKRMRITRSNKYGTSALQSRRRIIRMLIVVVLAFAICHLPFHARKVWQYYKVGPKWAQYQAGSVFSTLLTPMTFLIMFANSAINPLLYAFMSKKFRMSFKDLLCCKMRHSLRISRNASVRSTHAVALSQAGL